MTRVAGGAAVAQKRRGRRAFFGKDPAVAGAFGHVRRRVSVSLPQRLDLPRNRVRGQARRGVFGKARRKGGEDEQQCGEKCLHRVLRENACRLGQGVTGLNPRALKEQLPAFAGRRAGYQNVSSPAKAGVRTFKARGFSPVLGLHKEQTAPMPARPERSRCGLHPGGRASSMPRTTRTRTSAGHVAPDRLLGRAACRQQCWW